MKKYKIEDFIVEESEYQKFFNAKLKKYDVKSPSELSDDEKKKFFDEIEKEWTKDEAVEQPIITFEGKKYGISNGMLKAFGKGAGVTVKKVCDNCGFHIPKFTGRYPKMCPLCGNQFPMEESIGLWQNGICECMLKELDTTTEGKFSEMDLNLQTVAEYVVDKMKESKSKKELNSLLKDLKDGKVKVDGIDPEEIKYGFSELVKKVSKALAKAKIKLS
jgi:hypothetical protein